MNGIPIAKDDWIHLNSYAIQHNEKYWPQPEEFRPERYKICFPINLRRFLPGEKESIVPFSFLPFGAGPRNCVGQRLAYLEMKIALVHVLRRFKFTVDSTKMQLPIKLAKGMAMTMANKGIHLKVERR